MRPVDEDVQVDEDALKGVDSVLLGDEASVYHFVRNYGSHYITSFTTGNALYQVSFCYRLGLDSIHRSRDL